MHFFKTLLGNQWNLNFLPFSLRSQRFYHLYGWKKWVENSFLRSHLVLSELKAILECCFIVHCSTLYLYVELGLPNIDHLVKNIFHVIRGDKWVHFRWKFQLRKSVRLFINFRTNDSVLSQQLVFHLFFNEIFKKQLNWC